MQTQRFKVNSLTYHLLPVCLMLAICFLLFFRGIGETEFYDKQEAREALVIWEIHNSGNWILPLRNGEEIPAKPPFYHWLGAMLSSVVGRVDELSARLPSALLGTLGVLVTYAVGAVLWGRGAGLVAALVLHKLRVAGREGSKGRHGIDVCSAVLICFFLISVQDRRQSN